MKNEKGSKTYLRNWKWNMLYPFQLQNIMCWQRPSIWVDITARRSPTKGWFLKENIRPLALGRSNSPLHVHQLLTYMVASANTSSFLTPRSAAVLKSTYIKQIKELLEVRAVSKHDFSKQRDLILDMMGSLCSYTYLVVASEHTNYKPADSMICITITWYNCCVCSLYAATVFAYCMQLFYSQCMQLLCLLTWTF